MFTLEGLPPYEVHALRHIEHDVKQIWLLKENFAQTVSVENQRLLRERIDRDQMNIGKWYSQDKRY